MSALPCAGAIAFFLAPANAAEPAAPAASLVPQAGAALRFGELPPPPRPAKSAAFDATAPERLDLELIVNGAPTGRVVPVQKEAGRFALRRADILDAGLRLAEAGDPADLIFVDAIGGVAADYDGPRQRLHLTVAPERLPPQYIGANDRRFVPASYDAGALLNYDIHVSGGGGPEAKIQASLFHEARVFNRAGVLTATGMVRSGRGAAYVRFDTSFRRSDAATMTTIEVGDFITRTLPWVSAVRIGGIQVSRDFSVRPDIVTYPLPTFRGTAALPSAMELVVDGQRIAGGPVNPGPFAIESLPPINGYGEANLVVTDVHGRTVQETLPFYVASSLLKPGLTDFALAFGAFRQNYGLKSFDYGSVAASGSVRRGITDTLTLEVSAEIAEDMSLAGGGGSVRLGMLGTLSGSYSRSFRAEADGGDGSQLTLGYDYQARGLSLGIRHNRRSAAYVDLGLLGQPRGGWDRTTAATLAISLGSAGTLGLAYFDVREQSGADARFGNASWSLPLWRGSRINASVTRDFEDDRWSGGLTFSMPLGGRAGTLSAGLFSDGDRVGWRADYARPLPVAGGWGWNAGAATAPGGKLALRGETIWRGDALELRGGAYGESAVTAWLGASGALVLLDNGLFAANRVPDAFAVVSTGVPGIPVRYENQIVGTTNGDGRVLVPSVAPWYPALYAIDPLALPADMDVPLVEQRAAVPGGGGHVVRFAVKQMRPARVILKDRSGNVIAAGTRATMAARGKADAGNGTAMTVGWDGLLFIADMPLAADGDHADRDPYAIELADGRRCGPPPSAARGAPAAPADHQLGRGAAAPVINLGEYLCQN